jgi:beta-glucosidase
MLAELGFGSYRFSLEWSRIEPEEGELSTVALDHYLAVCAGCRELGIEPVVTFHHFTSPRWVAAAGAGPSRPPPSGSPASASGRPATWATRWPEPAP